ncbi:hypothetical protein Tco_0910009 [Tanacetum coccineum]|uniref:Uncharacterized protein n=1 Tax=Tanacetum coccineum TaxID=301880 RepID=A0ABQ5CSN1_9ASTR
MGKVQEFGSLTNLKVVLANEGFDNIKLKYMDENWVMIEFQIEASKENFKANMGIGSWYGLKVLLIESPLNGGDLLHVEDQDEGKVFWVRAKEVSDKHKYATVKGESGVEEVSETIFENEQSQAHKKDDLNIGQNDIRSQDLFNIYDLFNKKQDNIIGGSSSNDNLKYPPGFTPTVATKEIKK